MLEERAVVSRVEDGQVWVKPFASESCARCQRGQGCGGGVIGRLVSRRRVDIAVACIGATPAVGAVVRVGVEEGALMKAALAIFALPIAGLLAAGAFAHQLLGAHDLLVAAFAAIGLIGGFLVTRWLGEHWQALGQTQPRILGPARSDDPCAPIDAPR
ncbi:SoxR reducing system RseC family protein [Polycyclovorans algicola]|uniref:SoxR reducing system RseC family protein n=1 Tax=Polycyclovorans algicola TaxID=616992 RepID=UPI0004A7579E|nr:SoxR reducing system RseC family protein [Polycyclovorans algicola]